ncbi:MAG: dienelactone hydrolase family protein [Pseudomonadota bacterium]
MPPATCHNTRMTTDDRPPDCPGDCPAPEFPVALPADLLRLAFERVQPGPEGLIAWQEELRAQAAALMNLDRAAIAAWRPDWRVSADQTDAGVRRRELRYASLDGQEIRAWLLTPPGPDPWPAVLICHGHDLGADSAAGLIPNSDGQQALGLRLARAGFAVLAPDLISFGRRQVEAPPDPVGRRSHEIFANWAFELGRPIVMLHLTELLQSLAVLRAQAGVDPGRIGAAGLSQGGRLAGLVAAYAPGVAACLVASGITSLLAADRGNQHLHDTIPGLLAWADYPDLAGFIAPRPLMLSWGFKEAYPYCLETRAHLTYNYLRPVYAAAGAEAALEECVHPEGHCYDETSALDFFARRLGRPGSGA